jgi:hypothetical protein
MLYRKIAPTMACLCVAAAHAAAQAPSTQAPSPSSNSQYKQYTQSFSATGGVSLSQHLEASSSPIPFSGTGLEGRLRYERIGGRWDATIALDGAGRGYSSRADAGTSVHERAYDGALSASLLRAIGSNSASGFAAGVALNVQGGWLEHQYADPAATASDYVNGYALIGPAARWRHSALGGTATVRLDVPLFGVAHHPYTDARIDEASPIVRTVGPSVLHGYNASIGYESSAKRRIGFMAEFQARALDYADVQRSRTASTALSAGLIVRFGKSHP